MLLGWVALSVFLLAIGLWYLLKPAKSVGSRTPKADTDWKARDGLITTV